MHKVSQKNILININKLNQHETVELMSCKEFRLNVI